MKVVMQTNYKYALKLCF